MYWDYITGFLTGIAVMLIILLIYFVITSPVLFTQYQQGCLSGFFIGVVGVFLLNWLRSDG